MTKMKLPLLPQGELLLGLLLLMKLLVPVYGVPLEMHRSLRDQVGDDQQLEDSTSQTAKETSEFNVKDLFCIDLDLGNEEEALSAAGLSDTNHKDYQADEDDTDDDDDDMYPMDQPIEWMQPTFAPLPFTSSTEPGRCEKYLSCRTTFFTMYVGQLLREVPSCPCTYPEEARKGVATLFDKGLGRDFNWTDATSEEEHREIYNPSASACLRSMPPGISRTMGAQACCYDRRNRLLTRGKGAASPELISPYISPEQHYEVDRMPWIICQGDWRIMHKVLPPNNGLSCPERPSKEKYEAQLKNPRDD